MWGPDAYINHENPPTRPLSFSSQLPISRLYYWLFLIFLYFSIIICTPNLYNVQWYRVHVFAISPHYVFTRAKLKPIRGKYLFMLGRLGILWEVFKSIALVLTFIRLISRICGINLLRIIKSMPPAVVLFRLLSFGIAPPEI